MRDCASCIRSKGATEYDNGCTAWECDYINRKEAIEIWKAYKSGELIDLNEDVGKTCYKIYYAHPRTHFPNSYHNRFCGSKAELEWWKVAIKSGEDVKLYVKERPFTKSDRGKLGKTVFWTEEEAWKAIKGE